MIVQTKYFKVIGIGLKNSIEYRIDFLLGLLSCFFPILIQYYLWTAIFTNSNNSMVLGYTYNQIIMYTIMAALVTKLISTDFEGEINNDIKQGGLSKYLVQPINYFFYRISKFIGEKILHLIIVFTCIFCILLHFNVKRNITIELSRVLLFVFVIMIALILKFIISYFISVIAFWISECYGLFLAINVISTIISGGIFPIDIFENTAVVILKTLPFYYLTNFPINILNGKINFSEAYLGIAIQLTWIIILLIFSTLLWKIGMKKYIAAGG